MAKKAQSTLINMLLSLTIIAVVAAAALAFVSYVTEEPISNAQKAKKEAAIKAVLPAFDRLEETTIEGTPCTKAYGADGQLVGMAIEAGSEKGFGGHLGAMVGFDAEGNISGYQILQTSETPGLGAKAGEWFQAGNKGNVIGMNPSTELKVKKDAEIIKNGLIKENPTWVLVLGMCPTLATTTSAVNGMCMGLATAFVLMMSNIVISLLKSVIPDKVRIPAFIVVIATFVTIVQLVMQAYLPDLYDTLGLFIPLIVVNCIVLGRAEAFASKNNVWHSLLDGLFMGLGFTWALTLVGLVRELLGAGAIFGHSIIGGNDGMLLFILAPGGFIVLGFLMALVKRIQKNS